MNLGSLSEPDAKKVAARWYRLKQNPQGLAYSRSKSRFNVVPAGRRSGKTERAKRKWVRRAIEFATIRPDIDDGYFIFGAPTYRQAKLIFWDDLKRLVPYGLLAEAPRESDMQLKLVTGTTLACIGLEAPERHEGRPIDGGVLDEFGNMAERVWSSHLRPALDTLGRLGSLDFIGVPEGRNHYYRLFQWALSPESGDEWSGFTWKSSEVLDPAQIEAARRDLDELTFRQEYEAEFVTFLGRAYYGFSINEHAVDGLAERYDPYAPLIVALDFNRSPGVAVFAQELEYKGRIVTACIGEIHIPQNSNSQIIGLRIAEAWSHHQGEIRLYGDATGGALKSSSLAGSDWTIIQAALVPTFGHRVFAYYGRANPPERVRLNAVNSRLRTADGTIRLLFDRHACPNLIDDFDSTKAKEDGSIDKRDLLHSHMTDALGYYIAEAHPIGAYTGPTSEAVY